MDNKELIKIAYDMGAHPYSVGGMVAALKKGIEIGKAEQKAIDKECLSKRINRLFGENGGAEINGSWWDVEELEDFLITNAMEE